MITDNLAVGNRFHHHSLLHQTIEKEPTGARSMPVKPKRIFVQIVIEMFSSGGTLMNSEQSAFKQRRNSMNTRHGYMGRISTIREVSLDVCVTMLRNIVVSAPGISENR